LAVLEGVEGAETWHLYWATRAALLAEMGDATGASDAYLQALGCHPNESDERFLRARLAALSQ
jgi:predicted RNA polymerase sigma factor